MSDLQRQVQEAIDRPLDRRKERIGMLLEDEIAIIYGSLWGCIGGGMFLRPPGVAGGRV